MLIHVKKLILIHLSLLGWALLAMSCGDIIGNGYSGTKLSVALISLIVGAAFWIAATYTKEHKPITAGTKVQ